MFSKWFAIRWKCNKLLFSFLRCISPNFAAEICRLLCTFVILLHLHICWRVKVIRQNLFYWNYINKLLVSLWSKFWNHFVGDHDIGLSKALATKGAQWSENDIASEDFEQTSFKFGGFKLALSISPLIFSFFKFVFHNEGEERQREEQILNYSKSFWNVGDIFIVLNLCSTIWVKRGRGRCRF